MPASPRQIDVTKIRAGQAIVHVRQLADDKVEALLPEKR